MGYWPKHPRKELEALLREFDRVGWRIKKGKKYYRLLCPCGEHAHSVHITPSGRNYAKNLLRWLHRQECYQSEDQQ